MKLRVLTLCLWFLFGPQWIEGYRILAIFPFHAKSHFMMFERLSKGLADKGHQVDVISTFPLKKPYKNYTDLVTLPLPPIQLVNNMDYDFIMDSGDNSVTASIAHMGGNEPCENLNRSEIHAIVRNPPRNPPYDLVMIEVFGAHCYAIIGHLLNVPVIGVSSSALYPWAHDMIGNPENLAFVSNNLLNFGHKMNLWQRVYNTIHSTYNKLFFQRTISVQDDMIKKNFGSHMPSVRELETKLAMILTNSHISLNGISPMTPALIEVGGLHVHDDGVELSPALKKWLDESNDGFIYFSFGSMVKIETFPRKILDIFYKSMRKIAPVRVLMKIVHPEELPPDLPKNVLTLPWIPQLRVLKHRNIKAFITHGGLMGTQEAVHCTVPMIGIPLFADQFINIDLYVSKHIAIRLDHETLTEDQMDAALNAILKDPSYKEAIRKTSAKFLDRPLTPMDTAAYWIEYIIKYGEDALRSPAMDLTWWQIQLLDVYAVISVSVIVMVYAVTVLTRVLLNLIFPIVRSDSSHKKKLT